MSSEESFRNGHKPKSLYILSLVFLVFLSGTISYLFIKKSALPVSKTVIFALMVVLLVFLTFLILRYFLIIGLAHLNHLTYRNPLGERLPSPELVSGEKIGVIPHTAGLPHQFTPFVSILVPAYNEGLVIESVIKSLSNLDYPNYEVIIIDDGSTDDTLKKAQNSKFNPAVCGTKFEIRILTKPNGGKADALNYGLKYAKADFIMTIDGDCLVEPQSLRYGIRHFNNPKIGAVAGNVKAFNRKNLLSRFQSLEYLEGLNLLRRAQGILGLVNIVPGPMGIFRRKVLEAAGGYSSDTYAEDCDLTFKILSLGWKIVYEPNAVSLTEVPEKGFDLLRQRYRWTRGIIQSIRKHTPILFNPLINFGATIAFWHMCYEALIWPAMNIFAHLFLIGVAFTYGLTPLIIFWWLGLTALNMMAALFCVALEKEETRLVAYSILYRIVYTLLIDVCKVFATIEDFFGLNMNWLKIRRLGRINGNG